MSVPLLLNFRQRVRNCEILCVLALFVTSLDNSAKVPEHDMRDQNAARFGLGVYPQNYEDTIPAWNKVLSEVKRLDIDIISLTAPTWVEIEPQPQKYDWSSYRRTFEAMNQSKVWPRVVMDFPGLFFHESISTPAWINMRSFDDKQFWHHYRSLLNSYLDEFGNRTSYLAIHAEGAVSYFDKHPQQIVPFARFLERVRLHTKTKYPMLKVGINTEPYLAKQTLALFAQSLDFVGFDLGMNESVDKAADLSEELDALIEVVGDTPIGIVNIGRETSELVGGSEKKQAELIAQTFLAVDDRPQILFACFYTLTDDDPKFLLPVYKAMFPDYPDAFVRKMVEGNSSLGLYRLDGTAKPALDILIQGLKERGYKVDRK